MQLQQLLVNEEFVVLQRVLKVSVLLSAALLLLALTGCIGGSARELYFKARAIDAQGHDGDGSLVVGVDRSDELREMILKARRVQLADAER